MGKKVPKTWRKEPVQMQLQVQILYFSFLSIPFKRQLLAQQAALSHVIEGATLAANHLKFVFHIVWSPLVDPIRGPTIPGLEKRLVLPIACLSLKIATGRL